MDKDKRNEDYTTTLARRCEEEQTKETSSESAETILSDDEIYEGSHP